MKEPLPEGFAAALDRFCHPAWKPALAAHRGEGVVDGASAEVIELDQLLAAVDSTRTLVGYTALYHSLAHPLTDRSAIEARQEALRELEHDPELSTRLEHMIQDLAGGEEDFYRLLLATFTGGMGAAEQRLEVEGYGYAAYRRGVAFMLRLVGAAGELPQPRAPYLAEALQCLHEFEGSRACSLMRGPAYLSERGLRTRAEKPWYLPALRFRPTLFKPEVLIGMVAVLVGLFVVLPSLFAQVTVSLPVIALFLFPIVLVAYGPIVGGFDRDNFIYPLREIYKHSPEVHAAVEALGRLDLLLSFHRYAKTFGSATTLPRFVDLPAHHLVARRLRNPVLGHGNADYVPNDIRLDGQKLTFITGPNSGGKTAFGKTLAQTQILAQAGGYVAAEELELSIADHVFYLAPEINTLADREGRFGTELQHIKEIFLATSPSSLVILDEMAEGTTYEERLETSYTVLMGFYRLGSNTLLITHNHQLVDRFLNEQIGRSLQVLFESDAPTYRLVEGISRVSHAERIARRIGFGKEDIERYLAAKKPTGN